MKRVSAPIFLLILCMMFFCEALGENAITREEALRLADEYFIDATGFSAQMKAGFVTDGELDRGEDYAIWRISYQYLGQAVPEYVNPSLRPPVFWVQIDAETGKIGEYSDTKAFIKRLWAYQEKKLNFLYVAKCREEWCAQYGTPWQFWGYEVKAAFWAAYRADPSGMLLAREGYTYLTPSADDVPFERALALAKEALCAYAGETDEALSRYELSVFFREVASQHIQKGWDICFYEKTSDGRYQQKYKVILRSPEGDLYSVSEGVVMLTANGEYIAPDPERVGRTYYYLTWKH